MGVHSFVTHVAGPRSTSARDLDDLGQRYLNAPPDVRRQVDRLLEQSSDDAAWTKQLGAVYRQAQVADLLGKTRQAVSADPGLLRLTMRSGDVGYPAFQFDGDRVLPGIRDVVKLLTPAVATTWTIASWLTSPQPDLNNATPLQLLRDRDSDVVTDQARRAAIRLAG